MAEKNQTNDFYLLAINCEFITNTIVDNLFSASYDSEDGSCRSGKCPRA